MAKIPDVLPITVTNDIDDASHDAILLIASHLETDLARHNLSASFSDLVTLKQLHASFESDVTLTVWNKKRLIYSPTGTLTDYDDVRSVADAATKAVHKALAAGSKRPLVVIAVATEFELANMVALLAVLEALHHPLEVREAKKLPLLKVDNVGYFSQDVSEGVQLVEGVTAIELGRIVTRDIGGSDPERMSAANVATYVQEVLGSSENIKITVVEGQENFERDYPLFAAVNRAANVVPRHRGRIVKLEYSAGADDTIDTSLYLVGKGITYDTGGADVKAGGHMAGMHRDKCGAAFVAGFFKTLALTKPKGLKVYGVLCLARNSIGEEAYVADELITSRGKRVVRVGNTDAEGRMVMADPLCEAKELALNSVNPLLFTIATLTGHVIRAYGPDYTAIMPNGPAKLQRLPYQLQDAGDVTGDPYEISSIRRDDFRTIAGKSEYEDLLQSTNNPSTQEPRGHQFPAAFLIRASGLDECGNKAAVPLPYCHVDIAGSSGPFPGIPTGSPLPSFFHRFILPRL